MFCYQCQETAKGTGCTIRGVCGKTPDVAAMQDLLIFATKGLSCMATQLREEGHVISKEVNHLVTLNLFATITNTNFDKEALIERIKTTNSTKWALLSEVESTELLPDDAFWIGQEFSFNEKAASIGVLSTENEDIRSLKETITYGLKGMAAYMKHANALGKEDENIDAFIQLALTKLLDAADGVDELFELLLETGRCGVEAMALLDEANTNAYGDPEISFVNTGVRDHPGILASGHDLRDLEMLLEQTENTGIDVYSHSEMLPAHFYPALKKFPHFVGNYGGAWWRQTKDFASFNGPILMTTNCLVPPDDSYKDRLWTTGAVGYPGCLHIDGDYGEIKDFYPLIARARYCAPPDKLNDESVIGGFAHEQILAFSDPIVAAVKSGLIRKFVVMAGCDGRMKSRQYYADFARQLPKDIVILTAGCAKYRFNSFDLGNIDGLPRILDAGQCNDSYSLIRVLVVLKDAFGVDDLNDLPVVFNLSWYEQKAVIVLLSLLYLGIKNIHLGPTLPAFLSKNVANLLIEKFGIAGIGTVDEDLALFFGEE